MFLKLFLAFTLVPVAEIYLLIEVGRFIGSFNTVLLVIVTGFVGAYLARLQGMHTLSRVRSSMQHGIVPKEHLLDALLIFVAGIVLLTPGFITDGLGMLLLLPITRQYFKQLLKKKINQWIQKQNIRIIRYP